MINNDEIPKKVYLCQNHVISVGRQMTNSMLNFEYLLFLSFFTMAEFCNLGHLQGIIRLP